MMELSLEIVDRQQFGPSFAPHAGWRGAVEQLRMGMLELRPHPTWSTADLTDWNADPFADRNWRFQRHTLRWIVPLAYFGRRGDSRSAHEWVEIVRAWVEADGEDELGAPEAWTDMAVGLRAIVLSLGAGIVPGGDRSWYVEALERHRDWLAAADNLGERNHALHQHQGLLVVSSLLRDREGQALAVQRMTEQFASSFDAQGCNDEGSARYHQLNLIWWREAWERVRREGLAAARGVEERLNAAAEVLAHLALPSGNLVQIGDGQVTPVAAELGCHARWVATGGREGSRPNDLVKVLDRGYVLARNEWSPSATFVSARFGKQPGVGHAHEDRGGVSISSGGTDWVVDSGFSSYQSSDPTVPYLRSVRAHNVATLVDRSVDMRRSVLLKRRSLSDAVHDFVIVDERFSGATITRRIVQVLEPDFVLVLDSAEADDASNLSLRQRWHLGADVAPRHSDRGYVLKSSEGEAVLYWIGRSVQWRLIHAKKGSHEAWLYPRWKTAVPSTVVEATASGARATAATLIARSAPEEFGIVEAYANMHGDVKLTVMRGPRLWKVRVGSEVRVEAINRRWHG